MSYLPIHPGFNESLIGVEDTDTIYNKLHGFKKNTIIIIIISALIFVTIISIFDVFRTIIDNKYSKLALTDPRTKISKKI